MSKRNLSAYTDTIRHSVSAYEAGKALGLNPNSHGRCACPAHHGQDRNCKLSKEEHGFYCFVCHATGDVIQLVQVVNDCSFVKAVEWLNSTFTLGLPLDREESPEERRDAEIARKQRQIERELKQAIRDELFETYLNAGDMVMRLELDKEDYRPRTAYEEWRPEFVTALRLLTEAKELAVEARMEAIGSRH